MIEKLNCLALAVTYLTYIVVAWADSDSTCTSNWRAALKVGAVLRGHLTTCQGDYVTENIVLQYLAR